MKKCPYCKEEIRDDAVKCHYCQTVLLPATTDPAIRDKRVILVVDRGLIYFGKFAAFLLTIFIMGGLVFYGVNLKEALEDVQRYRNEARDLVDQAEKDMQNLRAESEDHREDLEELTERADSLSHLFDKQAEIAQATVALVERMTDQRLDSNDLYDLHKLFPAHLEQIGDFQGAAKALVKVGDWELEYESAESARSAYEKAIDLFKQSDDPGNQARISLMLADLELQLDRAEQARRIYGEAIALYQDLGDYFGLMNAYFGLAEAEEKLGHTEEASQARKQAVAISPYQEVLK